MMASGELTSNRTQEAERFVLNDCAMRNPNSFWGDLTFAERRARENVMMMEYRIAVGGRQPAGFHFFSLERPRHRAVEGFTGCGASVYLSRH
jgi:hypothetical protein